MFDDLFTKSLKPKPKYNLQDRTKRSFTDRHKKKFEPSQPKAVTFFNKASVQSVYSKDLKFTNHYSNRIKPEIKQRLESLSYDLTIIKKYPINTVDVNNRVEKILGLYLDDFKPTLISDDVIQKVSIQNSLSQEDGVRVYFLLNNAFDAYEILLIDPFHLVIPSSMRYRGKILNKQQALNKNFDDNKQNNECISDFFKLEE